MSWGQVAPGEGAREKGRSGGGGENKGFPVNLLVWVGGSLAGRTARGEEEKGELTRSSF